MRNLMLLFSLIVLCACSRSLSTKPEQQIQSESDSQATISNQQSSEDSLLGLPPVPVPVNNPQTAEKIALGDKLFHDKRFSIDGTVSCTNCHDRKKAFTDGLRFSRGHSGLMGSRSAPTVVNAAFYTSQFWDGRELDLEGQSKQPFINPVEGGLTDYNVILKIVRTDPDYEAAFLAVFDASGQQLTIDHIAKAIASFERTLVSGNSAFDRYYFKGDTTALSAQQIRGFNLFIGQGRCVSCHTIEQDHALFTDSRFHNIGIGINDIQQDIPRLAVAFQEAKNKGGNVDVMVLADRKTSELGRFAVTNKVDEIGAFKTPTLRNVDITAPYMHDGSLKTLNAVVEHYNNGGVTPAGAQANAFLSGGIRPLKLERQQVDDLVAFLKALTSPEYAKPAVNSKAKGE